VVSLDPFFEDASICAARYGRRYQKPVITVDAPYEGEVAALSDVIVIAGEFRGHHYTGRSIEDLFQAYRDNVDGVVIMTAGKGEIVYGTKNYELERFPAFSVDTVDTTGAGDSFRAWIVYGHLQNWGG
jgi:sugar/nucleoside kinase (ribokinase family)